MGRRRSVAIVDLVAKKPVRTVYSRLMYPNYASIMPQVIGVWAEARGHDVHYLTYTGAEDLLDALPHDVDIVFVCAYTQAAYLAYALANVLRQRGAVTVLGGPHARSYAADARRYFDYVIGLADRALIDDLLADFAPHPGEGVVLGAARQALSLPGVRERWRFLRMNLDKVPFGAGGVPMLGSLGCPYTCSFCIDSQFDYQTLPYDQLREDLIFLRTKLRRPLVGWHDPNFGVRFDDYMRVIEEAGPPGAFRFVAESSLSLLSEPHLKRLQQNGFLGLIVGIESWFDFNDKTRQGRRRGADKVASVTEHVNRITRRIPYVQTNFVWGLDQDAGPLPFDLNREFVDRAPAAFPSHSVFTAYGESAPLSAELHRGDRVLDVPFQFLDTASLHNVALGNYGAAEFYARLADVVGHSYAPRATLRRFTASAHRLRSIPRWIGALRSLTSLARSRYYGTLGRLFDTDREFRAFAAREVRGVPRFFRDLLRQELGPFYAHLPPAVLGALSAGRPA